MAFTDKVPGTESAMASLPDIVHVISDAPDVSRDVVDIACRYHTVEVHLRRPGDLATEASLAVIIDLNLTIQENVEYARAVLGAHRALRDRAMVIFDKKSRRQRVQAMSLPCQHYLARPFTETEFLTIFRKMVSSAVEACWEELPEQVANAAKSTHRALSTSMENAAAGKPVLPSDFDEGCASMIEAANSGTLYDVIDAVRHHHDYTYRHCVFVAGYLLAFARQIGLTGANLQHLASAALVHDIGKAHTPLEILDKASALDETEWTIMRRHTTDGRDILLRSGGWDPQIVDAVLHHHEKLDGSGYPDGLKGSEISDIARLISLADVFSALVDERSYKRAMSGREAYGVLSGLGAHLDIDMVRAFEPVAMARP